MTVCRQALGAARGEQEGAPLRPHSNLPWRLNCSKSLADLLLHEVAAVPSQERAQQSGLLPALRSLCAFITLPPNKQHPGRMLVSLSTVRYSGDAAALYSMAAPPRPRQRRAPTAARVHPDGRMGGARGLGRRPQVPLACTTCGLTGCTRVYSQRVYRSVADRSLLAAHTPI